MRVLMQWRGGGRCVVRRMSDIAARLRAVLPSDVALAEAVGPQTLWPGEVLPSAVPARLAEFAAGRSAARQAMRGLGFAPVAIPMGPDRAPIWPKGMTGSITHCAGACLAVTGVTRSYRGLGLDVKSLRPLPQDLWPTILRPEELFEVTSLPPLQQGLQVVRFFVAKEAAYKAQYAATRQIFDFQTLRITFENQRFTAQFCESISHIEKFFQIEGVGAEIDDFFAAFCWLPTG